MSSPHINTFEHDIETEIQRKEATMGDIASYGGEIGNEEIKKDVEWSATTVVVVVFIIVALTFGVLYFGFKYYENKTVTPKEEIRSTGLIKSDTLVDLGKISTVFINTIGRFVNSVEKSSYGYTIKFGSYSSVFAYMLKNEKDYADDIANAVGSARDINTHPSFSFTDFTINNQNMRVGKSASTTVVYAFVNTDTLLISSSTEGILTLRGDILRK